VKPYFRSLVSTSTERKEETNSAVPRSGSEKAVSIGWAYGKPGGDERVGGGGKVAEELRGKLRTNDLADNDEGMVNMD